MQFFKFFPMHITNVIKKVLQSYDDNLEEIRFRLGQPIILKFSNSDIVLEYILTNDDVIEIMQKICENSIYSYQNQICNGYITVKGGHRVRINRKCCNTKR